MISESGYPKVWRFYRESCYNILDVISGFTGRPLHIYSKNEQLDFMICLTIFHNDPIGYLSQYEIDQIWPDLHGALEAYRLFGEFAPQ